MLPIVVTGGPCAGKTSVLDFLSEHLPEHGISCVMVPEAATALISSGIAPTTVGVVAFQTCVFDLQLADEAIFVDGSTYLADPDPLLILDRGLMDGKGYMDAADYKVICDAHEFTEEDIFARYGLVIHLESVAVGRPTEYSFATNKARYEDLEGAVEAEHKMLEVWSGHPHRVIIHCNDDFEAKCQQVLDTILDYVAAQRG